MTDKAKMLSVIRFMFFVFFVDISRRLLKIKKGQQQEKVIDGGK